MQLGDLKLAVEALPVVLFYRIGLRILPFPLLARICFRSRDLRERRDTPSPEALARAVSRAARLVRKTTCLSRSLAGVALLRKHDYPAQLRLGVARGEDLLAHAWVELDGVALLEGSTIEFEELADIESLIA